MRGSQEPRIKVEPHRTSTDGADAALLMAEYGYTLDAWQRAVIDCWLGTDEAGRYNVTSGCRVSVNIAASLRNDFLLVRT